MSADEDGIDGDAEDSGDHPNYPSFHGTHVASIIGAVADNDIGIAGGNWHSKLMTLRALGVGGGTTFDVMQAARFAAGLSNVSGLTPTALGRSAPQGSLVRASVINMSLGSQRPCSEFERGNFSQILAQGVSVAAAAGNSATPEDFSPAACPGVINVGAIGPNGFRAPYSNFGPRLTGMAPGGDQSVVSAGGILSTWWNSRTNSPAFIPFQGTSMATPHVATIVSLMLSVNPDLSPAQVKEILEATALDLVIVGRDHLTGFGRFDAFRAVAAAAGSSFPDPVLSVNTVFLDFGTVIPNLPVVLTNLGGGTLTIDSLTAETDPAGSWLSFIQGPGIGTRPAGFNASALVLVDRSGLPDGEYRGRLCLPIPAAGWRVQCACLDRHRPRRHSLRSRRYMRSVPGQQRPGTDPDQSGGNPKWDRFSSTATGVRQATSPRRSRCATTAPERFSG